uniref:HECT-type E3 ubiquitin transferase n=1 Tax=Timema genevievae TaxID=629358 RepID=A0A7R9K2T5_TIMGE|nr:unnamed protein product [Timema genevievae]
MQEDIVLHMKEEGNVELKIVLIWLGQEDIVKHMEGGLDVKLKIVLGQLNQEDIMLHMAEEGNVELKIVLSWLRQEDIVLHMEEKEYVELKIVLRRLRQEDIMLHMEEEGDVELKIVLRMLRQEDIVLHMEEEGNVELKIVLSWLRQEDIVLHTEEEGNVKLKNVLRRLRKEDIVLHMEEEGNVELKIVPSWIRQEDIVLDMEEEDNVKLRIVLRRLKKEDIVLHMEEEVNVELKIVLSLLRKEDIVLDMEEGNVKLKIILRRLRQEDIVLHMAEEENVKLKIVLRGLSFVHEQKTRRNKRLTHKNTSVVAVLACACAYYLTLLANALVVLSPTAEDGEIEVRISVGAICLTPSPPLPYLPPRLTLPGLIHVPPRLTLPEHPSVPPRLTLTEHPSVPSRLTLPEHPSVPPRLTLPEHPSVPPRLTLTEHPAFPPRLTLTEHPAFPPRLTLPEHSRRPFSYLYPHVSDHDVTVVVTSTSYPPKDQYDAIFTEGEIITEPKPSLQVYQVVCKFLLIWKKSRDKDRFEKLCRYLVGTLESDLIKVSYIGVALNKEHALTWISHMKDILWKCCEYLNDLRPESAADMRVVLLYLHTLVAFTSTNTWNVLKTKHMEPLKPGLNQLCANIMGYLFTKVHKVNRLYLWFIQSLLQRGLSRSKIALKHVSLSALVTLAIRPLVSAGFTEKLMTMFVIHILSVPALVLHVQNLAPEIYCSGERKPFPSRGACRSLQTPTYLPPSPHHIPANLYNSFKFLNLFVLTNAPLIILKRSKGTDKVYTRHSAFEGVFLRSLSQVETSGTWGVLVACIQVFVNHNILTKSLELLNSEQNIRIVFNTLEGNYALCLVGNLVHLAYIQKDDSLKEVFFPTFTFVISRMLESCQNYVVSKQSNLTYWHPVLGWFAQNMDYGLHEAMPSVKVQLYMLWSGCVVNVILGHTLLELVEIGSEGGSESYGGAAGTSSTAATTSSNLLRRALDHRTNKANAAKHHRKLGSPECTKVALLCSLYQTALGTLTQLRLDILTGREPDPGVFGLTLSFKGTARAMNMLAAGLCYQDNILCNLWRFLCSLGPHCGLKAFLDLLAVNTKCSAPEFQMLILFSDCMTHYVTLVNTLGVPTF